LRNRISQALIASTEPTERRKPQLSILLNRPPVKSPLDIHTPILTTDSSLGPDDLTSSPVIVEPYPAETYEECPPGLDHSTRRRVEGIYDRLLAATFGVKRIGRGYQFDNAVSAVRSADHSPTQIPRLFNAARRRAMPLRTSHVDKTSAPASDTNFQHSVHKNMHTNKTAFVRRAIGTIMWKRALRRHPTTQHSCL
jgi:hypothetical protein